MAAQDQGELFDVLDRDGAPLGVRKARGLVHRDGDWHRSLHIWVLLEGDTGEAPWVLFQQRSPEKDTWPGALDVAVTGHYRAGETLEDALREAEEEIGLPLSPGDVSRLGLRRNIHDRAPGLLDRELQDVLLASTRRGLAGLRPGPDEVAALVSLPLGAALRLARGEVKSARGLRRRAPGASGPVEITPVEVSLADLVPARDGYYERALDTIRRRLTGAPAEPWTLG
jgi:isopentenyldiphosphate isomerase